MDDKKARSVRLAQAKEEVERTLHELQGKFVDLEMSVSKGVAEVEGLKANNRELVGNNRAMSSFARAAQKETDERQKELALLKKAMGDSEFVPSGFEDAAAHQVVRDTAADLACQLKAVQSQMRVMKGKAGVLSDQWEEKVAAAEQECEEVRASLATATSSGSVHSDV